MANTLYSLLKLLKKILKNFTEDGDLQEISDAQRVGFDNEIKRFLKTDAGIAEILSIVGQGGGGEEPEPESITWLGWGNRVPFVPDVFSPDAEETKTSRMKFMSDGAITELAAVYANTPPPGKTITAGNLDEKSAVEYVDTNGTRHIAPLLFGGQTQKLALWNTAPITDSIAVAIPANSMYWIRTTYTGSKYLQSYATSGSNEGVVSGDALLGDVSDNTAYAWGPMGVIGKSTGGAELVVMRLGDSVGSGQGDANLGNNSKFDLGGESGIFGRAFGRSAAWTTNHPGQSLFNWLPAQRTAYTPFIKYCETAIDQLGINDVLGGISDLRPSKVQLWDSLVAEGLKTSATTITPFSQSTDGWATVEGQTAHQTNAVRVLYNDWLRDGAPLHKTSRAPLPAGSTDANAIRTGHAQHPLLRYFEVADTVESARNSGLWKPNLTGDGLHGNPDSYALMAPAIDATLFQRA